MLSQSFGFHQTQSHRLTQSVKLTHEQHLLVQGQCFTLRLELINQLRTEVYQPEGICPKCSRKMTPIEIIRGFNQDPTDYTTCCSACGWRFEPILICFGIASRLELPFFCDIQTLEQLRGLETFNPEVLSVKSPAIYRSAIVHFGGIRQAFEKIGIEYQFKEINDWKNKIDPFLGRLPDTVIATCVDVPVKTIRAIRRNLGIARYTSKVSLEEI